MAATLITAGDVASGLAQTAGNDGTIIIQTGPAGAKVNALSLAADGTLTLIKAFVNAIQSMIRLNTANGYGSTNTCITRFTNVTSTVGSDVTYADSATLGALFTVNVAGVYSISYSYCGAANALFGVSLNSTGLSTSIQSIPLAERLCMSQVYAAGATSNVSVSVYLSAGALIRPHADAIANGTPLASHQFTMTRVA